MLVEMHCEHTVVDRSPHPHKLGREKRQCLRAATMCLVPAAAPDTSKSKWLCRQHGEAALAKRDLFGRSLWRPC
jgi:hypothetical protein